MKPTCTAHACFMRWVADNMETLPVLEPAQVSANTTERNRLDIRFADGSALVVMLANDGASLFWSEAQ